MRLGTPENKKPGDVLRETQSVCQQSKDNSRNQAAPGFTCQPFLVSQAAQKSNKVGPIFASLLWTEPALYGKIRGAPFCFPDCVLGQTFMLLREEGKGGGNPSGPPSACSEQSFVFPTSEFSFIYIFIALRTFSRESEGSHFDSEKSTQFRGEASLSNQWDLILVGGEDSRWGGRGEGVGLAVEHPPACLYCSQNRKSDESFPSCL